MEQVLLATVAQLEARLDELEGQVRDLTELNSRMHRWPPAVPEDVGFSGTAMVAGETFTGLDSDPTKPFVVCDVSVPTAFQTDAAWPSTMPVSQEWYRKAFHYGDIHESRT